MPKLAHRCSSQSMQTSDTPQLSAPRRTRAIAALCDKLNAAGICYTGTSLILRYEIRPNAAQTISPCQES